MALSSSPRKTIPLASGDDATPRRNGLGDGPANAIRRVFYCGVVVEGCEGGKRLPEDVQDLVLSLGEPSLGEDEDNILPSASETSSDHVARGSHHRPPSATDASALSDVVTELVNTETSYVKRLRVLKHDYADPLRQFSRSKSTSILPPYEAKTLFGNIDQLLPVNEAFLADLEKMVEPDGPRTVGGIGDVALRHFRDLRGFEHYKGYYSKREEAQSIFEREMVKKSSGFAAYIDRIKYAGADTRNRIGLRELLMEPVQRIPRYTLLFRTMVKLMGLEDPQRALLIEAEEIASKIAQAETDEQTRRAAVMYSLSATIDGFPAGLISNSRRFIDCIDVDDVITDAPMGVGASTSASSISATVLHCTLFLFDDKVMVAKRPGNGERSGRALAGLQEVDKLAKTGGLPLGLKKSGMSCKGVFDITDIAAADVGDADFHIYLENAPQDQGDRWSGRPFRSLSVVFPPSPINLDPTRTTAEKERFLENLWSAQAKYRTRYGQSVVLCSNDTEVEVKGGRSTTARTYFNVYQRTAFLQEVKKTKIVLHIDPLGTADPLPLGMAGPPFVVVRVQPMAGEISRYSVTSTDPNGDPEEEIVQTARIPGRVVQTIQQYGLFKFRTGCDSRPATPTASARSRAHIFSLDAISRNLFSSRPGSSKGDIFGGSINSHRRSRSKSLASRSSIYTQTTTTADGSLAKFSYRSGSTTTAATSLASGEEDSFCGSRSGSSRRKLVKRSRSPASRPCSPGLLSTPVSRSPSPTKYMGPEETTMSLDKSEDDLTSRLELARRNSQNQHNKPLPSLQDSKLIEDTIYEEGPPLQLKRASRMSNMKDILSPSRARSPAPGFAAQQSTEARRFGPRSPSLPPTSPVSSRLRELSEDADIDLADDTFRLGEPNTAGLENDTPSPLPRSKRQPFMPASTDVANSSMNVTVNNIEPLSIKKKSSIRSGHNVYTSPRKSFRRMSPLSKTTARVISPRKISLESKSNRPSQSFASTEQLDRIVQLVSTTKEDVDGSRRALKRIKLDVDELRINSSGSLADPRRSPSPEKALARTSQQANTPLTREAQARLDEMRHLIAKRQIEGTPRIRPHSVAPESVAISPSDATHAVVIDRLEQSTKDADHYITRAVANHERLRENLEQLSRDLKEKAMEFDKARIELQNTRRQCELIKSLLADATAEKEIMYEAFNEELDAMYNDVNLPRDEAWQAMTEDLSKTKESRNTLNEENSKLKRRISELEAEKEEWAGLLRAHGLDIP